MNKKYLALIPARSGSKEFSHKNIHPLHGKPLISYTIEAALESAVFDDVLVSTDSNEYANVARECGAWVPFLRDTKFSEDTTPLSEVTCYVLDTLADMKHYYDYCCILQATCPFRNSADIIAACKYIEEKQAHSVVSVTQKKHPLYTGGELPANNCLHNFIQEPYRNINRQGMPNFYEISGALCIVHVASYRKTKNLYGKKSYAYVLSRERALDIDTAFDFAVAETLLSKRNF